jgi:hypothetical protein
MDVIAYTRRHPCVWLRVLVLCSMHDKYLKRQPTCPKSTSHATGPIGIIPQPLGERLPAPTSPHLMAKLPSSAPASSMTMLLAKHRRHNSCWHDEHILVTELTHFAPRPIKRDDPDIGKVLRLLHYDNYC